MPELPEVETIVGILKEMVVGKTIKSIHVIHPKTIIGDMHDFGHKLLGAKITDFSRVGKYIVFHFDKPIVMASHLRMEGKYFLRNTNEKPSYHDMVTFDFNDGTYLAYNDTRRFGTLELASAENYLNESPLNQVGPDPFMLENADFLIKSYADYSGSIKAALTDQKILSGLGNIYVDEVLFEIGVHPETPAKLVSSSKISEALQASKKILSKAIEAGGSTIHSYHPKEGMSGMFQVNLQVYGKEGEKCPRCGTRIRKIFVNGRGTSYCPRCQRNAKIPYILGVTGPIGSGKSTVSKYLESKGWTYLSADEFVHEIYKEKSSQELIKNIVKNLVIKNGEIDREFLRHELIKNPSKKMKLEKLVWNLVEERFLSRIKRIKNKIVFEVPLLFESEFDDYCDETLLVLANRDKQISNLMTRNNNVSESIKINSSYSKENIKKATYVIENNSDIANLYKQVDSIFYK